MGEPLYMACCQDPDTGKELTFVTNAERRDYCRAVQRMLADRTFFQWIKGNLKTKTFLGTSRNAVLTQIWIALSVYLLLAFLKIKAKLGLSMQEILRLLQLNLFERRNLIEFFKLPQKQPAVSPQLSLLQNP